jgi:hypothetical protein
MPKMSVNRAIEALAAIALLACCGCKTQSNTIVFVPSVSGANQDAVQTFVSDFSVALQEEPACAGLTLVLSDPYKDSTAVQQEVRESHWKLVVTVIPQEDTDHGKQLWSVLHDGQMGGVAWGAPKPMAHSVCSIVKRVGGSVQSAN